MKIQSELLRDLALRANPEVSRRFDRRKLEQGLAKLLDYSTAFRRPLLSVSLVGSKGKGSSAFFLEYLCRQAGLKTGLFTSPHLVDFRERIRINAEPAPLSLLEEAYEKMDKGALAQASYFELLTVLGLYLFQNVDIMILEAGLGGRFDATRCGRCEHVILTGIELEHTEILGRTEAEIIREKLAISGPWSRSLYVYSSVSAELVAKAAAELPQNVMIHHSCRERTLNYLEDNFREIGDFLQITPGLEDIQSGANPPPLPGRLELRHLPSGKLAVFDTAHTPASVAHVLSTPLVRDLPRPLLVAGLLTAERQADVVFAPVAESGLPLYLLGQESTLPGSLSFLSEEKFYRALSHSGALSFLFLGSHRLYPLFHAFTSWKKDEQSTDRKGPAEL